MPRDHGDEHCASPVELAIGRIDANTKHILEHIHEMSKLLADMADVGGLVEPAARLRRQTLNLKAAIEAAH